MKHQKTIILYGVNQYTSVLAEEILHHNENVKIVVFSEKRAFQHFRYLLPYVVSGEITQEKLASFTFDKIKNAPNIEIYYESQIDNFDSQKKLLELKTKEGKKEFHYDKFFVTHSREFQSLEKIEGIESAKNAYLISNLDEALKLQKDIQNKQPKKVVILGANSQGINFAEAMHKMNINDVTILEASPFIYEGQFDLDIEKLVLEDLHANHLKVELNTYLRKVECYNDKNVVINNVGKEFAFDILIHAQALVVNPTIYQRLGIKINEENCALTDEFLMTNLADVYVYNDSFENRSRLHLKNPKYQPGIIKTIPVLERVNDSLGALLARNIFLEKPEAFQGLTNSYIEHPYGKNLLRTGLSERELQELKINYLPYLYTCSWMPYALGPDPNLLNSKNNFDNETGQIYGGQSYGGLSANRQVEVIATLIAQNRSIWDMKHLELAYSPLYNHGMSPLARLGLFSVATFNQALPFPKRKESH